MKVRLGNLAGVLWIAAGFCRDVGCGLAHVRGVVLWSKSAGVVKFKIRQ
ncbi:MAG: hypothetical protein ACOX1I_04290 [Dethiobacteria bacterium]